MVCIIVVLTAFSNYNTASTSKKCSLPSKLSELAFQLVPPCSCYNSCLSATIIYIKLVVLPSEPIPPLRFKLAKGNFYQ